MAKALTVKGLEALRADPTARREIPDALLSGLYHVIQPTGARSWAVRYRFGGKPRKLTLGPYPALDLSAAREMARAALVTVASGRDPGAEKIAARKAADPERAARDLVENVVTTFVERYAKANTREASWRETERLLNKDVVPAWRGRRIQDLTKRDVVELLDAIVDRGALIVANRVLAAVRRMFAWCVERGILERSPCEGIKAPTANRSRDRVLSDDELRRIWKAADAIGWPFGPLVKVLMLTGQRRDEAAEMRWGELDLDGKLWTLPRERVKNDQAHEVPLSAAALAILEALPRVRGKAGLVFTTTGEVPVGDFSGAKSRLDRQILAQLRKDAEESGADPAEVKPLPHWTFHDLRRTMASGMARLGVNLPVIEKVLNHSSGSFAGVVGVYQRHSFAAEKRKALETWGRFVEQLVSDERAGNVVAITDGPSVRAAS